MSSSVEYVEAIPHQYQLLYLLPKSPVKVTRVPWGNGGFQSLDSESKDKPRIS